MLSIGLFKWRSDFYISHIHLFYIIYRYTLYWHVLGALLLYIHFNKRKVRSGRNTKVSYTVGRSIRNRSFRNGLFVLYFSYLQDISFYHSILFCSISPHAMYITYVHKLCILNTVYLWPICYKCVFCCLILLHSGNLFVTCCYGLYIQRSQHLNAFVLNMRSLYSYLYQ